MLPCKIGSINYFTRPEKNGRNSSFLFSFRSSLNECVGIQDIVKLSVKLADQFSVVIFLLTKIS